MSTININDRNICLKVSLSLPPFLQFSDMRSQLLLQCHACLPAVMFPSLRWSWTLALGTVNLQMKYIL